MIESKTAKYLTDLNLAQILVVGDNRSINTCTFIPRINWPEMNVASMDIRVREGKFSRWSITQIRFNSSIMRLF